MSYNLASRNKLLLPCNLTDLGGWYDNVVSLVEDKKVRKVLLEVGQNLNAFVRWPSSALLLWKGCNRITPADKKHRYHQYGDSIKRLARSVDCTLDGRSNGPAIAAYCLAKGERPVRFGSANRWSVHHLYSGKYPYPGRTETLHAAKSGLHFTQSAGLVAVHPIADGIVDEFPFFAWLLRAKAFALFGYDPDGVFSSERDEFGFCRGFETRVIEPAEP
jgi:hypothetical protein